MSEPADDLTRRLHAVADQPDRGSTPQRQRPPGLHHTALPEGCPGSVLRVEWDVYRREVGRLLAEGRARQAVLIKGEQIIGLFPTEQEARAQGYRLFPCQDFPAHLIREYEPLIRCVSVRRCPS